MKNEFRILSSFVLGAIAGVAAGLLFAPYSGRRTREELSRTTKKYVDSARDALITTADEVSAQVSNKIDELSTKGQETVDKARAKMRTKKSTMEPMETHTVNP